MQLTTSPPSRSQRPAILSAAATGLVDFIHGQGGDAEHVLHAAGADRTAFGQPLSTLRLDTYCRALEHAARETGNPNFGLCYGQQFKPTELGMLGYLGVASSTVGQALDNMGALFHHHQQRSLLRAVPRTDGKVLVEYRIVDGTISERRQDAELSLGMFVNVLRHALGNAWAPEAVCFEHARPELWSAHELAFGAPVHYAQPTNGLLLPHAELAQPMPSADAHLLALMRHNLQQLGLAAMQSDSLLDRVRASIRHRLNQGEPTLDDIAGVLGMASWTLQRRLRTEGGTFQTVLLGVRKDLALDYLRDHALQVSEIAFLLGYSEISAFSRAFQRWYGASPTEWRRSGCLPT